MRLPERLGNRLFAMALLLGCCWWRLHDAEMGGVLAFERSILFDAYQKTLPRADNPDAPGETVVVDIDEKSLAELGQWPWPRTVLAKIVDRLSAAGASAIGFDVVFSEPDRMTPARMAQAFEGLDPKSGERFSGLPDTDEIFADAIRRAGNVVLGVSEVPDVPGPDGGCPVSGSALAPADVALSGGIENGQKTRPICLLPSLSKAAAGIALINIAPQRDGVVRRIPAVSRVGGAVLPSLAVEMIRVGAKSESIAVVPQTDRVGLQTVARVEIEDWGAVNTDEFGRIILHPALYGAPLGGGAGGRNARGRRAAYLSAADVAAGRFDPEKVRGAPVLFGTSASGLFDNKTTAIETGVPGVDVHAQLIDSIRNSEQLSDTKSETYLEILFSVAAGLMMIQLVPAFGARWSLVVLLGLACLASAWSWGGFAGARTLEWAGVAFTEADTLEYPMLLGGGQLRDPVFPILTVTLIFMMMTWAGHASEEAARKRIRAAFGRYLSPALVERLAEGGKTWSGEGEMREMTLLFCDVRGFTAISESFGDDAKGLTGVINRHFLSPMSEVILSHGGTIDKYMGDCVMAFWNAPLDEPRHAALACDAALSMGAALPGINKALSSEMSAQGRKAVAISVGVGLNTGVACVGEMGSARRVDYSVLGDTVNLASRLEGQSKEYGVLVVVGDSVRKAAPKHAMVELDLVRVKGKELPVRVWALAGGEGASSDPAFLRLEAAAGRMLSAMRAADFKTAREAAEDCRGDAPAFFMGGFADAALRRIDELEAEIGAAGGSWDGVRTAHTK